jgi:hypothetical protein
MSRMWYTLGLLVFAAACGDADDAELDEFETFDAQEQTVPATPATPTDTMLMQDTRTGDTTAIDTVGT